MRLYYILRRRMQGLWQVAEGPYDNYPDCKANYELLYLDMDAKIIMTEVVLYDSTDSDPRS